MSYHKFKAEDGTEYGSFEVFYMTQEEADRNHLGIGEWAGAGWYWWACFPGCMPDGDPQGPYESEEEAVQAAQMENL